MTGFFGCLEFLVTIHCLLVMDRNQPQLGFAYKKITQLGFMLTSV